MINWPLENVSCLTISGEYLYFFFMKSPKGAVHTLTLTSGTWISQSKAHSRSGRKPASSGDCSSFCAIATNRVLSSGVEGPRLACPCPRPGTLRIKVARRIHKTLRILPPAESQRKTLSLRVGDVIGQQLWSLVHFHQNQPTPSIRNDGIDRAK